MADLLAAMQALGPGGLRLLLVGASVEGRHIGQGFGHRATAPGVGDDRAALALARRCLRDFVRRAVREEPALALRRLFVDSGLADRLQLEGADGMARAGNFNKACVVVGELARESCGIADVARQFADYLSLAKEAIVI